MSQVNFSELNQAILNEHNRIRAEPQAYIPYLQEYLEKFKGTILYKAGQTPIQTAEGIAAVEECILFLKKQVPVDTLTFDIRIFKAADDHLKECGPRGLVTHDSIDGKNASERIEKYCEWSGALAENIDFGSKKAQDCLINMIVDDGIPGRGHRKNIFNPELKYIGIASGAHRDCETMVVINYVSGIRDLGKPYYDYSNFKYEYPKDLNKPKEKKMKTSFQLQDEDAPDNTVSIKLTKSAKLYDENKVRRATQKFYTLADGTIHIVEIEEV